MNEMIQKLFGKLCIFFIVNIFLLLGAQAQITENDASFGVKSNDIYKVISPKPDTTIKNGQLFMCILVAKNVEILQSSLKIFLDGRLITAFVKFQNHKITMLYQDPLKKGKHEIYIEAKEKGFDWLKPLKLNFFVDELLTPAEDSVKKAFKRQVELTGNVILDSRIVKLTGKGADIRQEPPHTNTANVNANLRAGKLNFPIRIFHTSDEKTYEVRGLMSRNFYAIGMNLNRLQLTLGDHNTNMDKLVLSGIRVRGARLTYKSKRFQFIASTGYISRAIEGQVKKYEGVGFPPPGLKSDSTYYVNGTGNYRRDIAAVRFLFGTKTEGNELGLTFLKSRDDTNSIKYGSAPKENLVIGLDQSFTAIEDRFSGGVGAAVSVVTNDITGGTVKQADFEKRLNTELYADPYKFRKIQTINYSTIIPSRSTIAGYAGFKFKRKNNTLGIDYKYFGAGYQSFGNPFVRTDLQTASLNDQLYMWKRRVTINARYTFQSNNLSKTAYTTIFQHLVSGNVAFIYSAKAPQFILTYNLQARRGKDTKYTTLSANDRNSSLTGMILYNFKTGKVNHSLNLNYTSVLRTDKIYTTNGNQMDIYAAGLREQISPINTTIDFQYSHTNLTDLNGSTPVNESYDTRIRYQNKKIKTTLGLGYIQNRMLMERFGSQKSVRHSYVFTISTQFSKHLQLDFEAGDSPYRNPLGPEYSYDELYFYGRLNYNLGYYLKK